MEAGRETGRQATGGRAGEGVNKKTKMPKFVECLNTRACRT